jgi:hypothetical protein
VTLIAVVLLGAIAVGKVRGGSLRRLAMLRLPHTGLVIAAAVLAAIGQYGGRLGLPAQPAYVACTLLSVGLAATFVIANRHVVGVPLIALGFALNAAVIVANGAMPVSQRAADFAGVGTDAAADGSDARHELMTPHTRLRPLADVIPLHLPGRLGRASNVYSAGDVVLAAGIGLLVMAGMDRPGAGRRARQVSRGRLEAIDLTPHVVDVTDQTLEIDPAEDVREADAGQAGVDPPAEVRAPSSFPAPW